MQGAFLEKEVTKMPPVIHNMIQYTFHDVPERMRKLVNVFSTIDVNKEEQNILNQALLAVTDTLDAEGYDWGRGNHVMIYFCDTTGITLYPDNGAAGEQANLIMLNVNKLSNYPFWNQKIIIYIEELCHAFWHISDEIVVKYKVVEVINRFFQKDFSINTLYRREWLDEEMNGRK